MFLYHLKDHASGSGGQASIPSVKTIKGETLKDIGIIANKGAIKKRKLLHKKINRRSSKFFVLELRNLVVP
jgi:hypothetical protein